MSAEIIEILKESENLQSCVEIFVEFSHYTILSGNDMRHFVQL